jgi:hypothetical protein
MAPQRRARRTAGSFWRGQVNRTKSSAAKNYLHSRREGYQELWKFVVLRLATFINVILVESDS